MSRTPEWDAPDQGRGSTQQGARPDEWNAPRQGSTPGQEQYGQVSSGSIPGRQQGGQQQEGPQQGAQDPGGQDPGGQYGEPGRHGQQPEYGQQTGYEQQPDYGQAQYGQQPDYGQAQYGQPGQYGQQSPWASRPGRMSPVSQAETRVTWRRIFQYWIDAFFVSIVPYLVSIPFDRSGRTSLHIIGGVLYVVLFALIGLWYWVIRPHSHNGQTFAMKWFGLRVISKDGGPANIAQLFIRWICLLFDSAPWMWPLTGLLGLVVMLCSRYRQRIGDHAARTLVIAADPTYGAQPYYGQPGSTWERHPGMASGADQPGAGQRAGAQGQREDR
jgi:uncharacterized RDD family membrane protein YckC